MSGVRRLPDQGVCPVCHGLYTITRAGVLRPHGPNNRRCPGSHTRPRGDR